MRAIHVFLFLGLCLPLTPGCSRDETPLSATSAVGPIFSAAGASALDPPVDMVSLTFAGEHLDVWPYLSPNGSTREDPLNLVLTGSARALEIRAALLALDGDRTAFGFPPVYPFNATWSDAVGGVQAGYAEGSGWTGSVVQLQLGNYGPVRVHLRLFETGVTFGDDGVWTLGGAHFEILIPGTPEHQVISWELAEQMVTADLVRAGLLLSAPSATAVINDAPGFRAIPPAIYNGIPDALKIARAGDDAQGHR